MYSDWTRLTFRILIQEGKGVIDGGRDDDLSTYSLRERQGTSILNINLNLRMN